jgi:hypothetical protein
MQTVCRYTLQSYQHTPLLRQVPLTPEQVAHYLEFVSHGLIYINHYITSSPPPHHRHIGAW